MYPEYAEIKGKQYKIDTSFKTALKCFEVINDETISNFERELAVVYLLFDFIPKKDIDLFLEKATYFLQCGETTEQQLSKEADMDFEQDRKYIVSSFMSDYHIDINKEDMHWWYFIELIQGLTESCSLSRIRDIRNYDLREITDPKQRKKMEEAKRFYALKNDKKIKLTQEQEESMQKLNELLGL